MPFKSNQPHIDIKAMFEKKRRRIAIRIEAATARGLEYRDSRGAGAIYDFADHVLETVRECAFELLRSVPEAALQTKQWSEALDLCNDFVDAQGEYLFQRCLQLWGSEAQTVQAHIDESCGKIKAQLGSELEITHRLKSSRLWETRAREAIKIPPQETLKLLLISVAALALGFLLGKLL